MSYIKPLSLIVGITLLAALPIGFVYHSAVTTTERFQSWEDRMDRRGADPVDLTGEVRLAAVTRELSRCAQAPLNALRKPLDTIERDCVVILLDPVAVQDPEAAQALAAWMQEQGFLLPETYIRVAQANPSALDRVALR
jgi:hypothetical protein